MQVSIVMPVLNEAQGVEGALRALAPLRHAGVEVIVVDGGSHDGTAAIAAPLADQLLHAPPGRGVQMNRGAAAAAGELLLFLHADTRLPDQALPLLQAACKDVAHQFVWGRFDVAIAGRSPWLPVVACMMNLRSRLSGIATGDQAIFVRRAAFEAVGGFPAQPLMEDIELSRRLRALHAPRCLRQRVVTSGRRWDTRGAWRTIVLMWRLRWLYWRGTPADVLAARYR